jgi:hypothetical protein
LVLYNKTDETFESYSIDPAIRIPSVGIASSLGEALAGLGEEAHITLTPNGAEGLEQAVRWLIAEEIGGLRDLWAPYECQAAFPGKVSDPSYHCSDEDLGGVHANSLIPSHAYAMLVDGGTYNGRTIRGIGLTKAAHIYWQAMEYQLPYTDFSGHADALEAACADLLGVDLTSLTTGEASGEAMTEDDCAQVASAAAAVELRAPPTQCDFGPPLLDPNAPPLCSPAAVLMDETFEAEGGGWAVSHAGNSASSGLCPERSAGRGRGAGRHPGPWRRTEIELRMRRGASPRSARGARMARGSRLHA